jgi:hypothetical protein
MKQKNLILLLVLLNVAVVAGCTTIKTPNGWEYKNYLFSKKFSSMEFTDPNGASLKVKGLVSDSEALIEAAARGAATGANPAK